MFKLAQRSLARQSLVQVARKATVPIVARTLTTTPILRNTAKQVLDVVKSEYKIAVAEDNELDPSQMEYLKQSKFETIEQPSTSNVQLYKELPNGEELRVFFDIDEVSDVSFPAPEAELEDGAAEAAFENEVDDFEASFANVKVLVSKPKSNDGLFFNLILQDSAEGFQVDYFNYKPNVSEFLAHVEKENTFLTNFEYQGPRFSNLDESLQITMESFLEEKGIDTELADFVFSYAEVKEENSYRQLLDDVAKYLEQ